MSQFTKGHHDRVFSGEFKKYENNYAFATASADGTVKTWVVDSSTLRAREESTFIGHVDEALRVCWHPNKENLLVSGGAGGNIKIWNTAATSCDRTISCSEEQIYALKFTDDIHVLSGYDHIVGKIDIETGTTIVEKQFASLSAGPGLGGPRNPEGKPYVFDLDKRDNSVVVSLADGSIRTFDARMDPNDEINGMIGHRKYATSCRFVSIDSSQYIASCSGDGTIIVWDQRTWKPLTGFQAHNNPIYGIECIQNTEDSNVPVLLSSWSSDCSLRFWDLKHIISHPEDEVPLYHMKQEEYPLYSFAISGDGKIGAICGGNSTGEGISGISGSDGGHGHSHCSHGEIAHNSHSHGHSHCIESHNSHSHGHGEGISNNHPNEHTITKQTSSSLNEAQSNVKHNTGLKNNTDTTKMVQTNQTSTIEQSFDNKHWMPYHIHRLLERN